MRATLEGKIDPRVGYLCDIKVIDQLLRNHVQMTVGGRKTLAEVALAILEAFGPAAFHAPAGTVLEKLDLLLSPHTRISIERSNLSMIQFTQAFEFSASHRLFLKELSDIENRRVFGKCSNPHGHGHNYVLEVTLTGAIDRQAGNVVDVEHLDRTVREKVIDAFDHRNLNVECAEFAEMNPTVENIAKVIWDRLNVEFSRSRLSCIRVWETPKTYAEYRGE